MCAGAHRLLTQRLYAAATGNTALHIPAQSGCNIDKEGFRASVSERRSKSELPETRLPHQDGSLATQDVLSKKTTTLMKPWQTPIASAGALTAIRAPPC